MVALLHPEEDLLMKFIFHGPALHRSLPMYAYGHMFLYNIFVCVSFLSLTL